MTDTIYRADAIEAIFKVGHEHVEEKVIPLGAVTDYSDAIKALPSAEAVQVVRCKDCKYYGTMDCQIQESFYGIKDFDFCSYGERKGGDDECV